MEDINLDEYELVPAIYFSQRSKPTILITAETVLLNDAAVKKIDNVEYAQKIKGLNNFRGLFQKQILQKCIV